MASQLANGKKTELNRNTYSKPDSSPWKLMALICHAKKRRFHDGEFDKDQKFWLNFSTVPCFFYNMFLWHLFLEHLCTGCEAACEGFVERANVCQNLNERKNCMHIRQFTFDIAGIVCYIAAYQPKIG